MPTPFVNREFADGYEWVAFEASEGNTIQLLKFPSDISYRKATFAEGVMDHPAKANLFLVEECIKYLSDPGDMVMDVMAGSPAVYY